MPTEGLKCSHSAFPPLSPLEVLFYTAGITAAGGETRLKAIPPPPPHQSFGRAKGGKEGAGSVLYKSRKSLFCLIFFQRKKVGHSWCCLKNITLFSG